MYIDKQKDLSDSYFNHGIRLDIYVEDNEESVLACPMGSVKYDEARHAREDGYAEGLSDGRAAGWTAGLNEGRNEMFERLVSRLMEAQSLSREEAEKILAEPVS